jgi:hypothetical protein
LDRGIRQNIEIPERRKRSKKVERHRQDDDDGVWLQGQNGEAMSREVTYKRLRYHNHLDESIVTTEWGKMEEETLL